MRIGVNTRRADVVWNYVGTAVSMASGFVLLPMLMLFLSSDELGLWYVYVAVANLAMLFEFGFNPTFARNIVYVVSGAKKLTAKGCSFEGRDDQIDWHLLNVTIKSSKVVYAAVALIVFALLSTAGSAYVALVASEVDGNIVWASWWLFVIAIVLNLYFLYSVTILRGYGDVAGENISKTAAKLTQLFVCAILLYMGVGLIGAAIGYLVNSLLLRVIAIVRLLRHKEMAAGRKSDASAVTLSEIRATVGTIAHIAWRDGAVQLAYFASTQAMAILSSLFLGLSETGLYSILLQFATAVCVFASAYSKSFLPSMQSAFATGDVDRQKVIAAKGIIAFWALIALGTAGIVLIALPLLPLFKPGLVPDYLLLLALVAYLALLQQHSVFCNYILSGNEIPYMGGYLVAAFAGVGMVCVFCGVFSMGAWGIVLGQAVSQILYNNWKWPKYFCNKLGVAYPNLIHAGFVAWRDKLGGCRKARTK